MHDEYTEEVEGIDDEMTSETQRTKQVETFAATGFKDSVRGRDRNVIGGRWATNAALIKVASGGWKVVTGFRKARSEEKILVRFASSIRAPNAQVHMVDEEWLFKGTNVDKIIFGFLGGRFSSGELTAEVRDVKAPILRHAYLRGARGQLRADRTAGGERPIERLDSSRPEAGRSLALYDLR